MAPLFAFLLILGVAFTAHHAGSGSTDTGAIEAQKLEQSAPCPQKLAEPRVRDLTVPFERRVYLLPSGKTCRPRSFAAAPGGVTPPSRAPAVPAQPSHQDLHDAQSDE